jgi:alkylation response protein AidB-like acyl-CoA dehydrogenase
MCRRANERVIAPNGKTLATRQTVQNWVAESAAEIQAARLLTLYAAWRIDTVGAKEARDDISIIKWVVANTMNIVVDRALQVHGGLGMTDDTILAFFYRHERAARIYDGADEVHKTSFARRVLKRYAGDSKQGVTR